MAMWWHLAKWQQHFISYSDCSCLFVAISIFSSIFCKGFLFFFAFSGEPVAHVAENVTSKEKLKEDFSLKIEIVKKFQGKRRLFYGFFLDIFLTYIFLIPSSY